ncbi:protein disulfide isomerase-like 1-3 [Hevea brasiliensis]|uniref:protein disulfide isomerase-like 1-3 n=1 Tax=Hevea brasiliensis TaxID=3981 RepID=UPI0025CC4111|nr:protein disulfide isomerase-like 1-3 [Hevea brasiliensis]
MSTTRIFLLVFTLFCFTPFSHFSSSILAKALFHHSTDEAEAEAADVSSISIGQHHRQISGKPIVQSISPAVDEKDVVVLTNNNFSEIVNKNQYVMINFYAPWCAWSQKLAPEYAAAATMLKGNAVLAKIDCDKETRLAMKFKIDGWPTLYLLIGGAHKVLYNSKRTRDAIVNWVNQIMNITVQNVTTIEDAERLLVKSKSVRVLGLLDTLEAKDSEELAAVSKLHIDVKFYQTTNADVAELFHIDQQIKRHALVLVKWEGLTPSYIGYEGEFTRLSIGDFVSMHKIPSVIPFTLNNADSIYRNRMKQLWLFAPERSWEVISIFEEVEKAFKGNILFVHVETSNKDSYIRELSYQFGVTDGSPTVLAVYKVDWDAKKYKYDGELTLSGIKSFAEEFLEEKFLGKLEPAMMSFA